MTRAQKGYESFLLRLWRATPDGVTAWQASLESTRTGERRNFATMQDLIAFLCAHTETPLRAAESPAHTTESDAPDPGGRQTMNG